MWVQLCLVQKPILHLLCSRHVASICVQSKSILSLMLGGGRSNLNLANKKVLSGLKEQKKHHLKLPSTALKWKQLGRERNSTLDTELPEKKPMHHRESAETQWWTSGRSKAERGKSHTRRPSTPAPVFCPEHPSISYLTGWALLTLGLHVHETFNACTTSTLNTLPIKTHASPDSLITVILFISQWWMTKVTATNGAPWS